MSAECEQTDGPTGQWTLESLTADLVVEKTRTTDDTARVQHARRTDDQVHAPEQRWANERAGSSVTHLSINHLCCNLDSFYPRSLRSFGLSYFPAAASCCCPAPTARAKTARRKDGMESSSHWPNLPSQASSSSRPTSCVYLLWTAAPPPHDGSLLGYTYGYLVLSSNSM